MKAVKNILNRLVYSNVFIALGAASLVVCNEIIIYQTATITPSVLFVFFATLLAYSALKFRPPAEHIDANTNNNWVKEHPQLSRNILVISLISSTVLFFILTRQAKLTVIIMAAVTFFYGLIPLPFLTKKTKLRDLGLIKTAFVAVVWSVSTVIIPLQEIPMEPDMLIFMLLRRFLFILGLTVVFEIKDEKQDRQYQLQTLPMIIGITNTKFLGQSILLLALLINLFQYFIFNLPFEYMLALNLSLLVSIIVLERVNESTKDFYYYFVVDGMMILQLLLVIIAYTMVNGFNNAGDFFKLSL